MGLIKTPIRSTMSHERLNHCMIFSTHKEDVDKLNLKKFATDFVLNVPKRKKKFCREINYDLLFNMTQSHVKPISIATNIDVTKS